MSVIFVNALLSCAAVRAAAMPELKSMTLKKPSHISLKKLYGDVPSIGNPSWDNANYPAKQGKALVYAYLNFTDAPPPVTYQSLIENDPDIIGIYRYRIIEPGRPFDESIEIKSGLSDELEFFVAVHELLHFGGFGTVHITNTSVIDRTNNFFNREFANVSTGGVSIATHWEDMSGTHIRSGQDASQEVMTPEIGGEAFIAAATFAACTRETSNFLYCLDDSDCDNNVSCVLGLDTTPGMCNNTVNFDIPHEEDADTAYLAIMISMLVIFVFILIGVMIASFESSFETTRYIEVKNAL